MTGQPAAVDGGGASFGAQLRWRREQAGFTLKQCAALAHYSESYLSRIENGRRPPLRHVVQRLDDVLGTGGALVALLPVRPQPTRPGPEKRGEAVDDSSGVQASGGAELWIGAAKAYRSAYGSQFDHLIQQGDACRAGGNMTSASEHYLAAYGHASDPAARAEAVVRLARRWSDPGQLDREVIHFIASALEDLEGDGSPEAGGLRMALLAHRAKKLSFAVSPAARPPHVADDEGARLARGTLDALGDDEQDEVRCEVLTECRWALFDHEPAAELLPLSLRLDEAACRARDSHFQGEALVALAVDQFRVGDMAAAMAAVARHRHHAARRGGTLDKWQQCTLDTLLDLWRGNFTGAREWIFGCSQEIVIGLEREMHAPADTFGQTRMGQMYWLLYEEGRLGELFGSGLVDDLQRHAFAPIWHAGLVLALTETGQWSSAADQLLAFLESTSFLSVLPSSGWSIPTLTLLAAAGAAIVAHGTTDPDLVAALPLIDARLAPHDAGIALGGWPTVLIGPVARARGLLALACGDIEAARSAFQRAARLARTSPPAMARLRLDQARALLVQAEPGAAQQADALLSVALDAAESLGMAALASQARAVRDELSRPSA